MTTDSIDPARKWTRTRAALALALAGACLTVAIVSVIVFRKDDKLPATDTPTDWLSEGDDITGASIEPLLPHTITTKQRVSPDDLKTLGQLFHSPRNPWFRLRPGIAVSCTSEYRLDLGWKSGRRSQLVFGYWLFAGNCGMLRLSEEERIFFNRFLRKYGFPTTPKEFEEDRKAALQRERAAQ